MRRVLGLLAVMVVWLGLPGAASAGIDVRVDIAAQRMSVTTTDGERYDWTISSGRQGFRSPNGVYRPTRLEKSWYSRKYGGAMPHAVFFRGGYAIHGTNAIGALGRPASHGCIRLHPANAAKLFALVKKHGAAQTRIALNGTAPDGLSQFAARSGSSKMSKNARTSKTAMSEIAMSKTSGTAKAIARAGAKSKAAISKAAIAQAKIKSKAKATATAAALARAKTQAGPGWEVARERILLRPALPAGAFGYQPYQGPGWR